MMAMKRLAWIIVVAACNDQERGPSRSAEILNARAVKP